MANRNFILCLLLQFWCMIAFNMTLPLIAEFVVSLGETTTMAGFVAGIFSFLALLLRPFSGFAADRMNKKLLLFVGYITSVIAFVGYGIAPDVGTIIAFRVLHALSLCIQTTVTAAAAMQFIPKDRVVEGVGYIGVSAQLGLAIAPTIGVMLADVLGYRGTFFASAIVMVATMALLIPIPIAPPDPNVKHSKISIRNFVFIGALPLTFTIGMFSICSGLTSALLVLMGSVRGIAGVTLFFVVSSLGTAALRPFAGRRVDKRGLNSLIPASFVSECACMGIIAFAGNLPLIALASVGRIFGQGVAQSSLQGQILKDAGPEAHGVANSTVFIGIDIGQGAGAMLGGAMADVAGFTGTFLIGPVSLVLGLVTYLYWYKKQSKQGMA